MNKFVLGSAMAILATCSAQATQWTLKTGGNSYGFKSSVWQSVEDSSVTTSTLTDQDECVVVGATMYSGSGENAIFYGKSLTIGSVAEGKSGNLDQYYNAKVYGGVDNEVKNDGLILERGNWWTEYGSNIESQYYPMYGKITVNATPENPFWIYRNSTAESALKFMGEVKGAGWLSVKGYKAPRYTLRFLGGYDNFSGGVNLVADNDQGVASVSRLWLPTGTCSAMVIADTGCQLVTDSVEAQVTLGKMNLADNAVLQYQATGTGATASTRVLNCSKYTLTTSFVAQGNVKVEVAYTDSANGKFNDAFDILTVPASSTLDESKFVFVPTDANHPEATFSVRNDGDTKTLVLTYVGSGLTILTQAEQGTNAKGLEGVKWSDGSTGTSADYNYATVGYAIYISSGDDSLNAFKGNSLRIGDAAAGTAGELHEYGGYAALPSHKIMTFPNDGLVLACGVLAMRYSTYYYIDGTVKVTAQPSKPFRLYHGYTKDGESTELGSSRLFLLGPLTGSGALQIDSGFINRGWTTNVHVNVYGDASAFSGSISLVTTESNVGCYGRCGLGLTNGVFGGSINVGTNNYLTLPAVGETTTVKNLSLADDTELRVSTRASKSGEVFSAETGRLIVSDNFTQVGTNTVKVTMETAGAVGGEFTILTVPATATLDKDQFALVIDGDQFYVTGATLKVTEDLSAGTKSLVLSIPQAALVTWLTDASDKSSAQIINDTNKNSFNSSLTNANAWSDSQAVHENAHYLCQATKPNKILRTPSNVQKQSGTFPGESLTLEGVGTQELTFVPVYAEYTIPTLRLLGNTLIFPCTSGVTLNGNLEVNGTTRWQVYAGGNLKITGQMTGSGTINAHANGTGSSNPGGDIEFTGDNSGYSGRLHVYATPSADTPSMITDVWGRRFFERLFASAGNNLGGAMSPADPQGVIIDACTMFIPRETMTIDVPTRGWQIVSNGRFNVTNENVTLTFKSPLAFFGTLYKEGAGRLELGNETVTFGADATATVPDTEATNNTFIVQQGSVKILTTNCLNGVNIIVRNATTPAFVIPTGTDAESDFRKVGLCNTLAATPFAVENAGEKIVFALEGTEPASYPATFALCTVAESQADAVAELITVQSPKFGTGPRARVQVVRGAAVEGRVTFSAQVDGPRSMSIILK